MAVDSPLVLDTDGGAMRPFNAGGPPMAVLVEDGLVASPVAAGADAVFALIGNQHDGQTPTSGELH